jgi:hypothetical protein
MKLPSNFCQREVTQTANSFWFHTLYNQMICKGCNTTTSILLYIVLKYFSKEDLIKLNVNLLFAIKTQIMLFKLAMCKEHLICLLLPWCFLYFCSVHNKFNCTLLCSDMEHEVCLKLCLQGGPYYDLLHSLLGAYACYRPDVGYVSILYVQVDLVYFMLHVTNELATGQVVKLKN